MTQEFGRPDAGAIGSTDAVTDDGARVEPGREASWPTVGGAVLFVVAAAGLSWASSLPSGLKELGIAAILGSFAWLLGAGAGWAIAGALGWRSLGRGTLAAVGSTAGPIAALVYLLGASP